MMREAIVLQSGSHISYITVELPILALSSWAGFKRHGASEESLPEMSASGRRCFQQQLKSAAVQHSVVHSS